MLSLGESADIPEHSSAPDAGYRNEPPVLLRNETGKLHSKPYLGVTVIVIIVPLKQIEYGFGYI